MSTAQAGESFTRNPGPGGAPDSRSGDFRVFGRIAWTGRTGHRGARTRAAGLVQGCRVDGLGSRAARRRRARPQAGHHAPGHRDGADYSPPDYIRRDADMARKHRWYMTSRLITINDVYSFDAEAQVDFEEVEDIVGRNFRQPREGLGFDGSPVAHMWRTMIGPTTSCDSGEPTPLPDATKGSN